MANLLRKQSPLKNIIAFIGLCIPLNSNAGLMVYQYKDLDQDTREAYLSGVLNGFSFANVELIYQKRSRIYCPPPDLKITVDMGNQLLVRGLEHYNKMGIDLIEIEPILLNELIRAYPCRPS